MPRTEGIKDDAPIIGTEQAASIERGTAAQAVGAAGVTDPAQASEQQVSVRALGSFHKNPDFSGGLVQRGEEFETGKLRATELRANELVEFVNQADEDEASKLNPKPEIIEGAATGILMRRRGRINT